MAYAPSSYVGNGVTTTFAIGFPYVRQAYVVVALDTIVQSSGYQIVNGGADVQFDTAPAVDVVIDITRVTSSTPAVDFQNAAALLEKDLDDATLQVLHFAEEAVFNSIAGMGKSGGHWDATSLRIQSVAAPVADTDVATKGSIQGQVDAAATSASNAATAQSAAATSATAANTAKLAAEAAQTGAEAAEAAITGVLPTSFAGGDAGKILKVNAGETAYEKTTLAAVLPFTKSFTSSEQAIATGGAGTAVAHGLGEAPKLVQYVLRCKTAELGYSVGDEVIAGWGSGGISDRAILAVIDATNVTPVWSGGTEILRKDTGAATALTGANWKLLIKAWA